MLTVSFMTLTAVYAGLLTLAVKHYERLLKQIEKRLAGNPEVGFLLAWMISYRLTSIQADAGIASETAYNLSIIYMTTGAAPLAEKLYRRWLTI